MGVFSRFKDIVNANINSLLDMAEDPEKMIKLMISEMEDTLIEQKTSCAATMAEAKKCERKINELTSTVNRWQSRAMLAIEKNREDLAKEALLEKKKEFAKIDKEKENLEHYQAIIKDAKEKISQLDEKLVSVKNKYKIMRDRAKKAEEEKKAKELLNKSKTTNFDFMEDRINRMEAMNDLENNFADLEKEFENLESMTDIEKELAELKIKMEK